MSVIRDYDRFWMDTDETGQKKPIGWDTLTEDAAEEEGEGVEEGSDFSEDLNPSDLDESDDESEDMDEDEDEDEGEPDNSIDDYDDDVMDLSDMQPLLFCLLTLLFGNMSQETLDSLIVYILCGITVQMTTEEKDLFIRFNYLNEELKDINNSIEQIKVALFLKVQQVEASSITFRCK